MAMHHDASSMHHPCIMHIRTAIQQIKTVLFSKCAELVKCNMVYFSPTFDDQPTHLHV